MQHSLRISFFPAAAYPQLRPISIDPHHHSGSDGDLHGKYGGALADSSMPQPAGRSLATRSQNPHLPPVAPVAPSLHTISTGLHAYTAAATAGAGPVGPSGTGRGRDSNKQKPDSALRSLGARSVPAAQAAAAAVMSASGHSMVSVPATALQASDQLAGLVIKGPGEAAGLGKSSGGLLQSMKKGLGKLSVSLGKGSKVDSAAGQSGDSSDDESGLDSKEEVQAGDEELADARHWLVSGGSSKVLIGSIAPIAAATPLPTSWLWAAACAHYDDMPAATCSYFSTLAECLLITLAGCYMQV